MPSDLVRLVQALKRIQICRGQPPWRYLDLSMAQLKAVMLLCRTGRARSRRPNRCSSLLTNPSLPSGRPRIVAAHNRPTSSASSGRVSSRRHPRGVRHFRH